MPHIQVLLLVRRLWSGVSLTTQRRGTRSAILLAILTAVVVIGPCRMCPAATLVDVRLVMDGSADPPGDKLDIRLLLSPEEPNITLEVRAFLISGEDKSVATRIRARGKKNRDQDGRFLATFVVERPVVAAVVQFPAVIPYADLDIPVGTHEIAYEVRGVREGKVEFVQPTVLSLVTLSDETRREMDQQDVISERLPETRTVTVVLGGERTRGGGPRPVEQQEVEVTEVIPKTKTLARKLAVNIPGAFRRKEAPKSQPTETNVPPPAPSRPLSDIRRANERVVYFATNRSRVDGERTPALQFGKDSSNEVAWGDCVVNIPVQHDRGVLEEPGWWKQRDPERHFLIESLRVLNQVQLRSQIQDSDVLLFVHGYNYTFEKAVLRTAQLHFDLEFPGRPVAFSWPSTGDLTGYKRDAEQAQSSADALATVLQELMAGRTEAATQSGHPRKLHVVAHSMGNRVFLAAVNRLYQKKLISADSKPFGQVILAAPDVDRKTFNELVPLVIDAAEQTTLYYCQRDAALKASERVNEVAFNKEPPVGLAPFLQDGLDTICADHADTSGFHHGYFAESTIVLLDMRLMLQGHRPTNRRPPLAEPTLLSNRRHWSFVPTKVADER